MAALSLITLARELWADEARFLRLHGHPWFVWTVGKPSDAPIVAPTLTLGGVVEKASPGNPVAIPILKGAASIFPMGITIGRTENNDVVLRHDQVSRFHAYLKATDIGLMLIDADSKNGTWINGRKLTPSRPEPLEAGIQIKFGSLPLQFHTSASMVSYLRNA